MDVSALRRATVALAVPLILVSATAGGAAAAAPAPAPAVSAPAAPAPAMLPLVATPGAGAIVLQKLLANQSYPYTQVSIGVPRLVGRGVGREEWEIVTGMHLVVDEPRPAPHAKHTPSQLDIYYRKANLFELRSVGGNLYLWADVRNWFGVPALWTPSARRVVAILDLGYGERWFSASQATLEKLVRQAAAHTPLAGELGHMPANPTAVEAGLASALGGLLASLSFHESAAAGGNFVFRSSGSLQSLANDLSGFVASIGKAVPGAPATPAASQGLGAVVAKGSYTLVVSTGGHGAYASTVELSVGIAGTGSVTVDVAFTHAAKPVVAPRHATAIPTEVFTGAR